MKKHFRHFSAPSDWDNMTQALETIQSQVVQVSPALEIKGDALKSMLKTVSAISDEVCIRADKNGIKVAVVDPAHVAMFLIEAPESAFDNFEVWGKDVEVGLDIPKVLKAMSRCGFHSNFKFKDNKIIVSGDSKRFTLSAIDTTGMSSPKVPELKLPSQFAISTSELKEIVNDIVWFCDHIRFEVRGMKLYASATGDMDSYEHPLSDAIGEDVKSMFPLDYVQKLAKSLSDYAKLTVNMGNDYPMKVVWNSDSFDYEGKLKKKGVSYTFLLAPRIESEDESERSTPEPEPQEPEEEQDEDFQDSEIEEETFS